MKIAESWNDVTISQYQEIVNVQADNNVSKTVEVISILTDTDSDTIRKMPLGQFYDISSKIGFIQKSPDADVRRVFELDGKKYGMIPDLNYITAGEWLDAEAWKSEPIKNLHLYSAMLFRPIIWEEGDDYKIDEHKTDGFMKRAELFRDKLSINKVFGAQVFFSLFQLEYIMNTKDSLTQDLQEMVTKTTKKKTTQKATKKRKPKRSTKRSGGII